MGEPQDNTFRSSINDPLALPHLPRNPTHRPESRRGRPERRARHHRHLAPPQQPLAQHPHHARARRTDHPTDHTERRTARAPRARLLRALLQRTARPRVRTAPPRRARAAQARRGRRRAVRAARVRAPRSVQGGARARGRGARARRVPRAAGRARARARGAPAWIRPDARRRARAVRAALRPRRRRRRGARPRRGARRCRLRGGARAGTRVAAGGVASRAPGGRRAHRRGNAHRRPRRAPRRHDRRRPFARTTRCGRRIRNARALPHARGIPPRAARAPGRSAGRSIRALSGTSVLAHGLGLGEPASGPRRCAPPAWDRRAYLYWRRAAAYVRWCCVEGRDRDGAGAVAIVGACLLGRRCGRGGVRHVPVEGPCSPPSVLQCAVYHDSYCLHADCDGDFWTCASREASLSAASWAMLAPSLLGRCIFVG